MLFERLHLFDVEVPEVGELRVGLIPVDGHSHLVERLLAEAAGVLQVDPIAALDALVFGVVIPGHIAILVLVTIQAGHRSPCYSLRASAVMMVRRPHLRADSRPAFSDQLKASDPVPSFPTSVGNWRE